MATITKLELQQLLSTAQAELVALRTEVSGLRVDNARLSAQLAAPKVVAKTPRPAYVPAPPTAEQHALRAAMAAAKAAAIATGRSVRVGA